MGLFSGIFGGDRDAGPECPHERLMPRWRGPEVMEDDSRAMGFICQDCQREFLTYRVADRQLIIR